MAMEFTCELDGSVMRAQTEDELVAQVESHIAETHPDFVGKLSREDILAKARAAVEAQ
ncbi:MAG TPA: hypothetical protein VFU33_01270 [Gaiellaceae bacterium]|nr:hypothetical protein [Gaiellaceae bacterium]